MTVTWSLLLSASAVIAQDTPPACGSAPGARYGVVTVSCAGCSIAYKPDGAAYHFDVEPVIVQVTEKNSLRPGDVVVAVNGHPITTDEGARQFSAAPAGGSTITVRRGRSTVDVPVTDTSCYSVARYYRAGSGSHDATPGNTITPQHARTPASVPGKDSTVRALGIGVICTNPCAIVEGVKGAGRRFGMYPKIVRLMNEGAATGLRIGDEIMAVDHESVIKPTGTMKLYGLTDGRQHIITVRRNGKAVDIKIPPSFH